MIIRENIDLYRYEIHSLVKAFYPEENVKVVVEGDPHAERILKEDPFVFMEVTFERNAITLRIHGQDGEKVRQLCAGGPASRTAASSSQDQPEIASGKPDIASGKPDIASGKPDIASGKPDIASGKPDIASDKPDFTSKDRRTKDSLKTFLYQTLSEYTGRFLPWGDLIGIRPTKIAMTQMENGASPEEAAAFMEQEHKVSPEKARLSVDIAQRESRILSNIHYQNGYSLYIGIPFCPTTCLYCSFPSFNIALWKDRVDDYLTALEREMAVTAQIMQGQTLDTVYIGGGTPTSLEADQLDRLCRAVETYFDMETVQEFTVEAGRADSITKEKLQALRRHPVTRISVNPQTMKEETLRIIGRHHTVPQVVDAFRAARACGFDNINMDIILGLPGEDAEDVQHTVTEIEKLSPDSLTVHSLAIKRASRLRKIIDEKGYPVLINTEETMQIAADGARRMGMHPYYLYRQKNMSGNFENVGYAREGKYGIYNILIMEEKQTIMALGAGAVTKRVFHQENGNTRIERCDNPKDVATYLANQEEMLDRKRRLFA